MCFMSVVLFAYGIVWNARWADLSTSSSPSHQAMAWSCGDLWLSTPNDAVCIPRTNSCRKRQNQADQLCGSGAYKQVHNGLISLHSTSRSESQNIGCEKGNYSTFDKHLIHCASTVFSKTMRICFYFLTRSTGQDNKNRRFSHSGCRLSLL